MQAQVRVYQWDQQNSNDVLSPTSNLIVSPPVAKIAANSKQLVRVIRSKQENNGSRLSTFRIMINELPVAFTKRAGVDFVMEYSVPIFVYKNSSAEKLQPKLTFNLQPLPDGKDMTLQVSNRGDRYAKLYALAFVDRQGKRTELNPGLLGYVLADRQMKWAIGKPASIFSSGGTMELLLNDEKHSETIAPFSH